MTRGRTGEAVGASARRAEDRSFLTGDARYIADLRVSGALSARFVRSPHPHADIAAIDTSEALALSGVIAVFTGIDMKATLNPITIACPLDDYTAPAFEPLESHRVRFQGDPVALVVAESPALAEDAAELVAIDYRPLTPVLDPDTSTTPLFDDMTSNVLYTEQHSYGDVDAEFAAADRVLRHTLSQDRCQNSPMEPRGGIADYDSSTGRLRYDVASQSPNSHRTYLASVLGMDIDLIQVCAPPNMGGSFGIKGGVFREDIAVCWAARTLGRPVRWIEDRRDHLTTAGQARGERITIEVALDADGTPRALRAALTVDQGAYPVPPVASAVFTTIVRCMLPNCYQLSAYAFTARLVLTNRCPYVAYRGPWEMAIFAAERTADLVARAIGEEPSSYRLRNLIRVNGPDPRMITGPTLRDLPQLGSTLRACTRIADIDEFRCVQKHAWAQGRLLGIGIATMVELAPGPWSLHEAMGAHMGPEPVRLVLAPDGRLTIFTAQVPHGQGQATTLSQVAATTLGLALHDVDVVSGDTARVPYSLAGTGASRSAALAGGAVLRAARTLRATLLGAAGRQLGVAAAGLALRDGHVASISDNSILLELPRLVKQCFNDERGRAALDVTEIYDSEEAGWAEATHCCWVEVDPELGTVRIPRYVIVANSGLIINPAIADGQLRGGATQGIGTVLFERSTYGTDGGQLTPTFNEYLLPNTLSTPRIEVVHADTERPGDVPYRGLGEGGAILAPAAVVGAIEDAVAHLGIRIHERHLPPWRIRQLIVSAGARRPAAS